MILKIFGERNTATNYLELLVNENIHCEIIKSNLPNRVKQVVRTIRKLDKSLCNWRLDEHIRDFLYLYPLSSRLGWKHRLLPDTETKCNLPTDVYYLLTVREPFAWLSSMYKRPHNLSVETTEMSFSEFLRVQCRSVRREMTSFKFYENPIEIWNLKTRAMLSFSKLRRSSIFRHEDLVLQPLEELERLSRELGVDFKNEEIVIPGESTKKDGRTKQDMELYICEKKWMEAFSEADIAFVRSKLDKSLTSQFDY